MKILVEHTPHSPYNPEVVSNGVETWTNSTIRTLRELGHIVTVMSCMGAVLEPGVVEVPMKPKMRGSGERFRFTQWYTHLEKLARDHDRVILTSELTASGFGFLQSYLKKVIYIEHYPNSITTNRINHNHWFNLRLIQRCGGHTYAPNEYVRETANASFRVREDEKLFRPGLPGGMDKRLRDSIEENFPDLYTGIFDIIPHLENLTRRLPPVNPKKIVWVGRCERGKRPLEAAKAMVELAEMGYECHIFTETQTCKKQSLLSPLQQILGEKKVEIHLDEKQNTIYSHLADANVLLWTTRDETVGLVGYEGAIHGCRVIYDLPHETHLSPSGHVFPRKWKTPKDLVKNVLEVVNEPFDREVCAEWFRRKYSKYECGSRLEEIIQRPPNPDYGRDMETPLSAETLEFYEENAEAIRKLQEEYRWTGELH